MKVWSEVTRRRDGRWTWRVWVGSTVVRAGVTRARITAVLFATAIEMREGAKMFGEEC